MDWQFLLFDPKGRIGQRDYWIGVAIIIGGNILADVIPILGGLVWLVLIWVGLCVYGKRLHDIGRTAGIHAIPWAANFVIFVLAIMMLGGAILTAIMTDGEVGPRFFLSAGGGLISLFGLGMLVWTIYTLWLGLAVGDAADNQYGPAPVIDSGPVVTEASSGTPGASAPEADPDDARDSTDSRPG